MITHERLLELCHYCPVSGLFTAKVGRAKRFAGTVMGTSNRAGYLVARMDRKLYYLHRLAYFYMTKEWPKEIDHINWVKSDNRWDNLRWADRWINMGNLPPYKKRRRKADESALQTLQQHPLA